MFKRVGIVAVVAVVVVVVEQVKGIILKCDQPSVGTALCSDLGGSVATPPVHDGPVEITSHVEVLNLYNIDETNYKFTISILASFKWKDARLKAPESNTSRIFITQDVDPFVWHPEIYFYDLRGMRTFSSLGSAGTSRQVVFLVKEQTFNMNQRLELDITCGFNHTRFPFDHQTCYLRFGVINFNASIVEFSGTESKDWGTITNASYMVQTTKSEFEREIFSVGKQFFNFDMRYSYTGLRIEMTRNSERYFWNFYIPLSMFVIVSWLSFLISIEQVPGRMGLLITLYLILVNTYSSTKETAPWLQTFGLLGIWMLGCQVIIFLPMLEYGFLLYIIKFSPRVNSWGVKQDIRPKLARMDWVCLFLMPIVFLVFVLGYLCHVEFSI